MYAPFDLIHNNLMEVVSISSASYLILHTSYILDVTLPVPPMETAKFTYDSKEIIQRIFPFLISIISLSFFFFIYFLLLFSFLYFPFFFSSFLTFPFLFLSKFFSLLLSLYISLSNNSTDVLIVSSYSFSFHSSLSPPLPSLSILSNRARPLLTYLFVDDPFRFDQSVQRIRSLFGYSEGESEEVIRIFPVADFPFSAIYPTMPYWSVTKEGDQARFVEPKLAPDLPSLIRVFSLSHTLSYSISLSFFSHSHTLSLPRSLSLIPTTRNRSLSLSISLSFSHSFLG